MTTPEVQMMSPVIPLLTVFLSGLFGFLVAVVSSRMSAGKDSSQHDRQKANDHYEEVKSLYAEHLSTLHLITTHTVNHMDEIPLLSAFSSQDAKLSLAVLLRLPEFRWNSMPKVWRSAWGVIRLAMAANPTRLFKTYRIPNALRRGRRSMLPADHGLTALGRLIYISP